MRIGQKKKQSVPTIGGSRFGSEGARFTGAAFPSSCDVLLVALRARRCKETEGRFNQQRTFFILAQKELAPGSTKLEGQQAIERCKLYDVAVLKVNEETQ